MQDLTERFLIDEQGMRCDALPGTVEFLLDCPGADFDIVDYSVRNLGWIEVSTNRKSAKIHAQFRPLTVSFGAVSALYELLSIAPWKAVTLEYDLFGWISETYGDGPSARGRLSYIVQSVVEFLRHPPFTSVEKSPACLYEEDAPESKTLASVLGIWQDCSGRLPEDLTHRIREIGVLPRLVLIDVEPPGSVGRFRYIGSGFTLYGDRWPREAVGRSFREQPDKVYAARVAESCMKTIQSAEPGYSHVDACIGMPEQESRRSRYKCLKTLWQTARGEPVLMITSVLTPDVDIPLVPLIEQRGH